MDHMYTCIYSMYLVRICGPYVCTYIVSRTSCIPVLYPPSTYGPYVCMEQVFVDCKYIHMYIHMHIRMY